MDVSNIERHFADLQIIWDELRRDDKLPEQADVIVVGGCLDLGLAERAAELYGFGISKKIICSGYALPGMKLSEARMLADHCIELGVPSDQLVLDEDAQNTGQNITHSALLVGRVDSAVLIHKPYMTRRFFATAKAQWPEPQPNFYVTHEHITFRDYLNKRDACDTVRTMLGDFKRMDEYVEKGFQIPQSISQKAKHAYKKLVDAGFDVR
ncbi:MAG TPA: YdcF family protein [Candidatus Saccharibacteria bacterium]|jgi:uncharacterized SAM-binding protein YcdF (DUF218 family)|nr:hypothetical protein [Patescibacteria group bacterium]HMS31430.1 YdcF family protein [Candidatus Saccharibacteria bacterium]